MKQGGEDTTQTFQGAHGDADVIPFEKPACAAFPRVLHAVQTSKCRQAMAYFHAVLHRCAINPLQHYEAHCGRHAAMECLAMPLCHQRIVRPPCTLPSPLPHADRTCTSLHGLRPLQLLPSASPYSPYIRACHPSFLAAAPHKRKPRDAHAMRMPVRYVLGGVLPLVAPGAAASEGAGEPEVNVLLAVDAHQEAGHVHQLLAHPAWGGARSPSSECVFVSGRRAHAGY